MIVSCCTMKDEKLEFAQFYTRNLSGHLWHIFSSRFLVVHENRVLVNQKTFLVAKRQSASLTITGKALNANANHDTQGTHAVSFFYDKINIKTSYNIWKTLKRGSNPGFPNFPKSGQTLETMDNFLKIKVIFQFLILKPSHYPVQETRKPRKWQFRLRIELKSKTAFRGSMSSRTPLIRGPHFCRFSYRKTVTIFPASAPDFPTALSANNTVAAVSDTRPFSIWCEIIMGNEI